jgi:hypothetical protein
VLTICNAATRNAFPREPLDAAVDGAVDEDEETCVSLMSVSKNSREGGGANRVRGIRRSRLAGAAGAALRPSDRLMD